MQKRTAIPYDLKLRCVEASYTMTSSEVYKQIFSPEHSGMSYMTFKRKLTSWRKKPCADNLTLSAGTYEGFIAHGATVQVDSSGTIRQAWIKQDSDDSYLQIIDAIKENIQPINIASDFNTSECAMLEIPFFDMHFGIANMNNYLKLFGETLEIIKSKHWEEINILLGQDLIHTNDMRGHTAKGTDIQKIDFQKAWNEAFTFWASIIEAALENSQKVNVRYSKGNHDECVSWCLLKALQQRFPQAIFDDAFEPRKAILWRDCFIGYGHCEYTRKSDKLFHDFVMDFSKEFSDAKVREIHSGHLHFETADCGIMFRRLASAVPADEWSTNNGFIGVHKRFQVFEWTPGKLKAIYYVG